MSLQTSLLSLHCNFILHIAPELSDAGWMCETQFMALVGFQSSPNNSSRSMYVPDVGLSNFCLFLKSKTTFMKTD